MQCECRICVWRNVVLPNIDDEEHEECHTPLGMLGGSSYRTELNREIMVAMHEPLPEIWKQICRTLTLYAGWVVPETKASIPWMRFPLRNMRPISCKPAAHFQTETDFVIDYARCRHNVNEDDKFIMYHITKLKNLVVTHDKAAGSQGILQEGGMRYGSMHGDGVGVYCHASRPYELFSEGDAWVMLELLCHPVLTKVKGGSKGRYLIKSDQSLESEGSPCTDCEVIAMLHVYKTLPDFMKF